MYECNRLALNTCQPSAGVRVLSHLVKRLPMSIAFICVAVLYSRRVFHPSDPPCRSNAALYHRVKRLIFNFNKPSALRYHDGEKKAKAGRDAYIWMYLIFVS